MSVAAGLAQQEHPVTAIVFIGSLLTLVFGVLNLIASLHKKLGI